MPAVSEIIPVPRTDIIPGYTLCPFTIESFAQAEAEFARKHLEIVAAAAETATDRIAGLMLETANRLVADKHFAYGSRGFNLCAFNPISLAYLLYLTMGIKHPKATLQQAQALIPNFKLNQAAFDKIQNGVLELIGFRFDPPKTEDASKNGETGKSDSSLSPLIPSSNPSESGATATLPSSA